MKVIPILTVLIVCFVFSGVFADERAELERYIHAYVYNDSMTVDTKCGTRYPLLIHTHWNEISESVRQTYKKSVLVQPIRERSLETGGGHFSLHWDETGFHAVPSEDNDQNNIPDYIDSAAVIFEHVWDREINQLGYSPPPINDEQTDSLYHVYFTNMIYYGTTIWFPWQDIPSIPGENFASYMEVENDFVGFPSPGLDGLKVTAAHEFHHAIQLGYNVLESNLFFYEMTSTWMEDVIYPEVNDYYQYLPYFFNSASNGSFNTYNGQFEYGNTIYLRMLQQKYGPEIVREIWDQMRDVTSLESLTAVLKMSPYNTSWLESLSEYGEWLYFTGQRAIAQSYFTEAAEYPEVRIFSSDRVDFSGQFNTSVEMTKIANRFYIIRDIVNENLYITLTGSGGSNGAARLLETGSPGQFNLLNNQALFARAALDSFAVIVTNTAASNRDYALRISSGTSTDIAFGPNPVILSEGQSRVVFLNLPGDADVFIYSISGKRISHLPATGTALRVWDLTTDRGIRIASGVYLVLIKGGDVEKIEKLTVLR